MRHITVFCAASDGSSPLYLRTAEAFGRAVAGRGITLVYGGACVGMMRALADAALDAGGRVIGVLPQVLQDRELAHPRLSELHVVPSLGARKDHMIRLADAFVALPGGLGTLDELFEAATLAQVGLHGHPIAVLNVAGYYDSMFRFLDHATSQGLLRQEHRALLLVRDTVEGVLDAIEQTWTEHPDPPMSRIRMDMVEPEG